MRTAAIALLSVVVLAGSAVAQAAEPWRATLDRAFGKAGADSADGVHRFGFPRSDLNVTLDGVRLKPAFALGSWLAFAEHGHGELMVMGDLVLTDTEVNPVMKRLLDGGLEITALHNHLLRASPHTMYMHVGGHGSAERLAATLRSALALSATPLAPAPASNAASAGEGPAPVKATAPDTAMDLDTAGLDRVLGAKGKVNGGVYQFSLPLAATPKDRGMPVPPSMGSAIAVNFQPTGAGKAAVTGDFVMTAAEVGPVMRALRDGGVEITALHNHMLDDEPRLFFMHFWADDEALKLARTLRRALDQCAVKR